MVSKGVLHILLCVYPRLHFAMGASGKCDNVGYFSQCAERPVRSSWCKSGTMKR